MIAFLPCAGRGTRLRYGDTPKELIEVAGRPMIDYSLDVIDKREIKDVVLAIAPGKESIAKYVALSRPHLNLMTVYQRKPLGTGNAVGLLKPFVKAHNDQVLYLMPDSVHVGLPVRIAAYYVSVYLWPTEEPEKMGIFEWRDDGFVWAHVEKKNPDWDGPYWAWGAAVLTKSFVDFCAETVRGNTDVEWTVDDAFDLWLAKSGKIEAFPCDGYYVDCGTLEGIREAERRLGHKP